MKLRHVGVGLLGFSIALLGVTVPAHAAGTLTIWVNGGEEATYKAASASWAAKNGVTLNVVAKCGLGDCGMAKLAPAGAGPDLVELTHDNTGSVVSSGLVESVGSVFNRSLFPTAVVSGVSYKYQTWGIPLSVSNIALATNLSLVPTGAPKTWKDLESTATSLIGSGKATVGIVTHLDGYNLQPFFDSIGGYVFENKSGAYTNTNKIGIYSPALSKQSSLMDDWLAEKLFDKSNTYDNSAFTTGKAPYAIVGPWSIAGLDKAGVKYDLSGIPSVNGGTARAFSGVTALYLNRFSKQKLLAKQFISEVAQTADFQKTLSLKFNNYPANKEAAASLDPTSVSAKFGSYGALCIPMPNIAAMSSVWTYWNNSFKDWASGKSKFGPAMQEAAVNLTAALKG